MRGQIDRAQIAHCNFAVVGVQRNFGTQIGAMHHAHMLLWRTNIAGILECDPRMASLKQHGQHLAPQAGCRNLLEQLDLAGYGLRLIGGIGALKIGAELVMQVRHIGWREQRPVAPFCDALHEQVGDPVGGIHIMGTAAVIASVLAQIQKFLDIQMPCFQIGAHCALAFAPLIHRHRGIVHHFQERHHALRLTIGALDMRAQRAHRRPVVTQTTCIFGKQGVLLDRFIDAVKIIRYCSQITGRQLRALRAGIEQGRRRAHKIETGQQAIELYRARFAIYFAQRQPHRNAHEKSLWQFDALAFDMQEVAVIQGLQAKIAEL